MQLTKPSKTRQGAILDTLKSMATTANISLVVVAISLVFVFFSIISKNLLNREVVFSYTALIAAYILFALNVYLSLQSEDTSSTIQSRLIADGNGIHIYSKQHSTKVPNLVHLKIENQYIDEESAKSIFKLYKTQDHDIYEKAMIEHMKFCVISLLLREAPDWRSEEENYFSSTTFSYRIRESSDKRSQYILMQDVLEKIKLPPCYEDTIKHRNYVKGLHLPKDSKIYTDDNSIKIKNPWIDLKFEILVSNSFSSNSSEDTIKDGIKIMGGGDLISVECDVNLKICCHYHRFRAGNKERKKIQSWVSNITSLLEINLKAEGQNRIHI